MAYKMVAELASKAEICYVFRHLRLHVPYYGQCPQIHRCNWSNSQRIQTGPPPRLATRSVSMFSSLAVGTCSGFLLWELLTSGQSTCYHFLFPRPQTSGHIKLPASTHYSLLPSFLASQHQLEMPPFQPNRRSLLRPPARNYHDDIPHDALLRLLH